MNRKSLAKQLIQMKESYPNKSYRVSDATRKECYDYFRLNCGDIVAIEEISELMEELSRYARGRFTDYNDLGLLEEITDVLINTEYVFYRLDTTTVEKSVHSIFINYENSIAERIKKMDKKSNVTITSLGKELNNLQKLLLNAFSLDKNVERKISSFQRKRILRSCISTTADIVRFIKENGCDQTSINIIKSIKFNHVMERLKVFERLDKEFERLDKEVEATRCSKVVSQYPRD